MWKRPLGTGGSGVENTYRYDQIQVFTLRKIVFFPKYPVRGREDRVCLDERFVENVECEGKWRRLKDKWRQIYKFTPLLIHPFGSLLISTVHPHFCNDYFLTLEAYLSKK